MPAKLLMCLFKTAEKMLGKLLRHLMRKTQWLVAPSTRLRLEELLTTYLHPRKSLAQNVVANPLPRSKATNLDLSKSLGVVAKEGTQTAQPRKKTGLLKSRGTIDRFCIKFITFILIMESHILSLLTGNQDSNASKHNNNAEYCRKQYPLSKK